MERQTGNEDQEAGLIGKCIRFSWKYFFSLFLCLYVFTAGIFSRRNRDVLSLILQNFSDRKKNTPRQNLRLPRINIQQFLGHSPAIRILEPIHFKGDTSLLELCYINQIVKRYAPKHLFEMGTFDGRTTLNLAANSPDDAVVYTLDLPRKEMNRTALKLDDRDVVLVDKELSGNRFRSAPESKKIVQLFGDTATFDFGPYENSMDFVFIDASHAYDYVLNDTRIALKLLRKGKGILVWHDYGHAFEGVTKALNEFYMSGQPPYSFIRHVSETSLAILTIGSDTP
jgi:hypothetical protein